MKASHITCMSKILTDLCFTTQRIKTKNTFPLVVGSILVVKMCWQTIKKFVWALMVHSYFKKLPVSVKVIADFECNLKSVEGYEGLIQKNIKITFLVVLFTNLFVLMMNLVSQLLFLEVKMLLMNLLKRSLKSLNTVKK